MDQATLNEQTMPRERLVFCEKYLEKFEIVESFKYAYPDIYVANGNYYSRARRVLKRKDVQTYIAHRREDMREIMCLDANRIAQEIAAVAFTDITDVMADNETIKSFDDMTAAAKKSIKKISVKETPTKFGIAKTTSIELHDKLRGLSDLMKVTGISAGDAGDNIGDTNITNNIIQISAADLTDSQLKALVSTGKMNADILVKPIPVTEEIVINDEDFG